MSRRSVLLLLLASAAALASAARAADFYVDPVLGSAVGAPPRDLLGVSRPQGSAYDLGAHERCPLCLFIDGFENGGAALWSGISP